MPAKSKAVKSAKPALRYQGSRWEVHPAFLEVCPGPWGTLEKYGVDVVGSWKDCIDWHADNGLNVIISNIPYSRTDWNYLGWGFHYILDLKDYPHHEDLFSADFRKRNLETLSAVFGYGKRRGVLMLAHHFNYMAPRRMGVAMGWMPRYPVDEADWTDGMANSINPLRLLGHNCCWNVPSYQEFMKHCWTETCRLLPDLGGFLVTPGEGNHGHFDESRGPVDEQGRTATNDLTLNLIHWYPSDMRYVETSAHFIKTFASTVRKAGRFPLVRSWSVEGAPHFMPRNVTYLLKHQMFDCIDAPGDPLVKKWLDCGHEMWVEAAFIGENAGPIQWAGPRYFKKMAEDIHGSGVAGAVTNHKCRDLNGPTNWLNYKLFHAAMKSPAAMDDRAPWVRELTPLFGAKAKDAFEAMELTSEGVLLISKIAHRVGEGWSFLMWPTLTPVIDGLVNLGHENGTPPPWWRGNLFTIKEYLDYLGATPWSEDWMEKARGTRDCPLQALESVIASAQKAERLIEGIKPSPAAAPAWQELRCSAAVNRWQCDSILQACRVKIGMACARACLDFATQKRLAKETMSAIEACERALAREREWVIQYPPQFGSAQSLVEGLGEKYRTSVRELQPFRRELTRFLEGRAWTVSRLDLKWRAMNMLDAASQPPARGNGIPLATYRQPWPATPKSRKE